MPGFPIRTSSDQRFIDNSPRLNAALHVLHRLSMPRHPPCALNNEHTTNTQRPPQKQQPKHVGVNYTKHKRTEITQTTHPPPSTNQKASRQDGDHSMRFNARVHYTVLTQHPTQPNNHAYRITTAKPRVGYNQGIMPQTPNNAPSTSIRFPCWLTHQPSG